MIGVKLKSLRQGFFIVFEGIDGSGKSSQARLLKDFLSQQGYDSVLLREPTEGPWGKKIRDILTYGRKGISPEDELKLFIEDRKENIQNNILPALKSNKVIVQDRYYFSTIAYQGALGIDPSRLREMNEAFAVKPDVVFYLKIDPKLGLERIETGRQGEKESFEKEPYLIKVKKIFDSFNDPFIKKIVGSLSQESIQKDINKITLEYLEQIVI